MNEHLDPSDQNFSKEDNDMDRTLWRLSLDGFAG
jgi:hypothetical protein